MLWLVFQPPKLPKRYKTFPNTSKNMTYFVWNPLNLGPIWIQKSGQKENDQKQDTKKEWSLKLKFAVWWSGVVTILCCWSCFLSCWCSGSGCVVAGKGSLRKTSLHYSTIVYLKNRNPRVRIHFFGSPCWRLSLYVLTQVTFFDDYNIFWGNHFQNLTWWSKTFF